jgi:hypothetical protein
VAFNPFFNWSRSQCEEAIADIQDQLASGALAVSHAGTGSAQYGPRAEMIANLRHIVDRWCDLTGSPRPTRPAQFRAIVVRFRGYRDGGTV